MYGGMRIKMNKRQLKKQQKKMLLQAVEEVLETCLEADDSLATLKKIRTRGEQHFKELGVDVSPEVFDEIMTQLEPIVKEELGINQ